ncbi:MAG: ATP-binding protein [Ignavibacteriales bacterium]|nr:ATP-binding protein [Ignavibacteriales bacterium]
MPEFRAKARAIELLGRGQIADLPTAITELWKNGYDAYGDNMGCNLYLPGYKDVKNPMFVVFDDGRGMDEKDLINKWIVIGTDSKVRGEQDKKGPDTLEKEPRIQMGEKGIGRLSVSYLGSQMLMITKKINEPCQLVLFHWDILKNYNLFIDQVSIPIYSINRVEDFRTVLENMKKELFDNFTNKNADWSEHKDVIKKATNDIKNLFVPEYFEEEILSELTKKDAHGTKIILFDPIDQIVELSSIDNLNSVEDSLANYTRSSLSGISNVFKISFRKRQKPKFNTSFWICSSGTPWDIISQREFFSEDDFELADHLIDGEFNEEGFFKGKVRVYDIVVEHAFRNQIKPGVRPYGAFKIKLGYIPGRGVKQYTRLTEEQFEFYDQKLEKFGGLYIYRDDFRVLPYGRITNDFLGFEERRSKGAGYYYFSHRRMFGYIGISRERNPNLTDKSGREGFINNVASREFTKDLIAFFQDLSRTYFQSQDEDEKNLNLRNQQQRDALLAKESEKKEKEKEKLEKNIFKSQLNKNANRVEDIEKELNELYAKLFLKKESAKIVYEEIEDILNQIRNKENEFEELQLRKPKRFKLTNNEENNLLEYLERYDEIKKGIVKECQDLVEEVQELLADEELKIEFRKKYEDYKKDFKSKNEELNHRLNATIHQIKEALEIGFTNYSKDFASKASELIPVGQLTKKNIKDNMNLVKNIRDNLFEEYSNKYESFVKHLEKINPEIDEDLLVGYYKTQYEELNKRVEAVNETAQLGMAIEIIDHQFNVLYSQMSNAIASLKERAYGEKKSKEIYEQLKYSFQHLERNHKLLTPLYRTTRRTRREIGGSEIGDYLKIFFEKPFKDEAIDFTLSKSFEKYSIYTFESIINPVFINLVNNSLYWLKSVNERKIHITYEDSKILFMNSGERIRPADLEEIFKLFYTKRPDGRGIGLYLARTNLRSIGLDIYATNDKKYNRLNGACFIIEAYKK